MGFTKFCAALLSSGDAEVRSIPADMLDEVGETRCCGRWAETLDRWFTAARLWLRRA